MTKKLSFLDEAILQATLKERERIIKLLEAEQLHDPDVIECHCGSWREAIALIKGEK